MRIWLSPAAPVTSLTGKTIVWTQKDFPHASLRKSGRYKGRRRITYWPEASTAFGSVAVASDEGVDANVADASVADLGDEGADASVAVLTSDKGTNEGTEGGHGHAISVAVTTRRDMSRFPFRFDIPSVRPV